MVALLLENDLFSGIQYIDESAKIYGDGTRKGTGSKCAAIFSSGQESVPLASFPDTVSE